MGSQLGRCRMFFSEDRHRVRNRAVVVFSVKLTQVWGHNRAIVVFFHEDRNRCRVTIEPLSNVFL